MRQKNRAVILSVFFSLMLTCQLYAADTVEIALTYPCGKSPKVFTTGWSFGARAILNKGTKAQKNISKQVTWIGTGKFNPKTGPFSKPVFASAGANTIMLSVKVGKELYSKEFTVQTVKPDKYAAVGDYANCGADIHGCPGCPHPVTGQLTQGNPKVIINGYAVVCVGSTGRHAACCGPNTFTVVSGDPNVLVDGKRVARIGDKTQHCGGTGSIGDSTFSVPGTYNGSFSGSASGKAEFVISRGKVNGKFTGNHDKEGGGSANLTLKGTFIPKGNMVTGTTSGTATYIGIDNKVAKATVKGTFKGVVGYNASGRQQFTGIWKGIAKGASSRAVDGTFTTVVTKIIDY